MVGIGGIDADAGSCLYPPDAQVLAHANHIVVQQGVGMAAGLAAFENIDRPLLPRKSRKQAIELHSSPQRMCVRKDAGAPDRFSQKGKLLERLYPGNRMSQNRAWRGSV